MTGGDQSLAPSSASQPIGAPELLIMTRVVRWTLVTLVLLVLLALAAWSVGDN